MTEKRKKRESSEEATSSPPILPSDLIMQILSWLPVKLLIRFTSVSKHWKSLILDPNFAKLHLQKSPKNTHMILTALDDEDDTWVVTPYPVRSLLLEQSSFSDEECCCFDYHSYFIVGSTNGLVCLAVEKSLENRKYELFIKFWNPSLRLRSKKAPSLNIGLYGTARLGFGYDDLNDTYKAVAVFWDHTTHKMEGRVHCMGDSCWRKTIDCPTFPILLRTSNGPFVNGSVNWLALHNLNSDDYKWENITIQQLVVFSLDLRKEKCKYILLPDGFGEVPQDEPALAVLRGRLCLYYDQMRTHFVLWEMREYGVQESWTRLVNVSYVHLKFYDIVPDFLLLPLCLSENGDVLLLANKEELLDLVIMYNRRDDIVEFLQFPNNKIWAADEHMHSLVLPHSHPH
ncbi:F-box protein interaction domain protein [Medicago truncatula]|uniref:F-box protein interaction domain protein n=1 Tax=Medicago truncatula TaxID=3880 RepID=A0A072UK88_MEDTR|nr:F-box protein interaction domain protein [Medicago truncatula]